MTISLQSRIEGAVMGAAIGDAMGYPSEFINSFVLAKLKVKTQGRYLWLRTITSTLVGQGVDSIIFLSIAFYGIFASADLGRAILSQWAFKVSYEILATPLTYLVVNRLKRLESEDFYDRETNFNPVKF